MISVSCNCSIENRSDIALQYDERPGTCMINTINGLSLARVEQLSCHSSQKSIDVNAISSKTN